MKKNISRRTMLAASAVAGLGFSRLSVAKAPEFSTTLKKALIVANVEEDILRKYKDAGFDGVECKAWDVEASEAARARAVAEKCGMKIHSVMRAWVNFNDSEKVAGDIESVKRALAAAQGYGADAILLVPCRIKGPKMPAPHEFDIAFDDHTGHVTRVVKDGNAAYGDYIEAQNHATDVSREALKGLSADAEKAGVVIGVENVWNNLWVSPDFAAHFVRSIDSPWVQFYFDVANHVKYSAPEKWIESLGNLIAKVHIKDFMLKPDDRGGKFVNIREGSVNWPSVRKELDKIGYNGWLTIEGSGSLSLIERSERLDAIIAGE